MSRIIEAPKIDNDEKNLATTSLVNVGQLRVEVLPRIDAIHATEAKRVLKDAVNPLNILEIFPTVEILGQRAGSTQESDLVKLLLVKSVSNHGNYKTDYFLTPEGELLAFRRQGEQTDFRRSATDKEYIQHSENALLAIEKRIQEAMDERPKLRLIKRD